MHNKRGQAAMEFLMTYGWAILAAITAIGVLAYFGVFSPGKYAPTGTIVNSPFYANAWNVQVDTNDVTAGNQPGVVLEVRNNGGETLTITGVTLSNIQATPTTTTCAAAPIHSPDGNVEVGTLDSITVGCAAPGPNLGTSFKADIAITYTKPGSTTALTSSGTITDRVVS